jgi:ABC-type antimicrobial peptide transport system permease subunit
LGDTPTIEEPVMKKSVLLGGLLGGIVVFIWGAISWMALPLHNATLLKFKDEAAVTAVVAANAPAAGVYLLPNAHADVAGMTAEQRKAREEAAMKQWGAGPTALVAVRLGGVTSMTLFLIVGLLTNVVAGLLVAWLASKTSGAYWGKVGFVVVIALVAGLLTNLPEWNWWGFSTSFTAVAFVDHVVGWFLGGLVIAKFG